MQYLLITLDVKYEINSFYDLAQMLLGELPTQFEFFYAICAVVLFLGFIAVILCFFGLCFRNFKGRW